MLRKTAAFVLVVFLSLSPTYGFDLSGLPFDLGFQIGFRTDVIPAPDDMSRDLGLVVAVHQVVNDTKTTLNIKGSITNFSEMRYDGVAMRFAVTSYIGLVPTRSNAVVTPTRLEPSATAAFDVRISLDDELPKHAMYTITAESSSR